ncbi:MAG: ATP-binding cassette domain-containing protein [Alphaproteobacteria bacterium]
MHHPIHLQAIGLSFPHKTCFEGLSTHIHHGQRIAIIGLNGSGKSTLLRIIQGLVEPSWGAINIPDGTVFGYVPQVIEEFDTLSGGMRFNARLTQALTQGANVLCLDEPTNHLDLKNRQSLMRLLQSLPCTLIVASHDVELLRTCVDDIWHIDEGQVHFFPGSYDAYVTTCQKHQESLEAKLSRLEQDKKQAHLDLMQEQKRAKKRKIQGEKNYNGHEKSELRAKQGQGERTTNRNKRPINETRAQILHDLQNIRISEVIKPKFNLTARDLSSAKAIVSITDGTCSYARPILKNINLTVGCQEHVAIVGDNGSGKTTLIKGILLDPAVKCAGTWNMPQPQDIGYLDQHYSTLTPNVSVLQVLQAIVPEWPTHEIRRHLNDFLFRKNEEIAINVQQLSGGEKARLSLACIAARSPKLLILDEITNNLDLETREHVIQVLQEYPGAMMVISHDADFLQQIRIDKFVPILDFTL